MYQDHTSWSFFRTNFNLMCQRDTAVASPFFTMQLPGVYVHSILNGQKLFGRKMASAFLMTSTLIAVVVSVETISSSFFDSRALFVAGASAEEKRREASGLQGRDGLFNVLNGLDIPQEFRQIINDSEKEVSPEVYSSLQAVLSEAESPEILKMLELVKEDPPSTSSSAPGDGEESLTSSLLRDRGMVQQLQSATRVSELVDQIAERKYSDADAALIEEEIARSSAEVASGKMSLQVFEKRLLEILKLFPEEASSSSHSSEEISGDKIDTDSGVASSRGDTASEEMGENEEKEEENEEGTK
ncbi:hypothetical protein CSUI_003372 [Cystoisospora suis]|uniref:Uncharacterized protein n=1 Tax=Cystoisospora suis TaxID=483139 RepID=A0A2C6L5S8_9APIC|nr:hypothetical protein CSUI_003372 [Cystoisospora suis]